MSDWLVHTKWFLPRPRPQTIPRPHLQTQYRAITTHPLTLVVAPAGFGKTTLITNWIHSGANATPPVTAWLSLDSLDNDPIRFGQYLAAAIHHHHPALGPLPGHTGDLQPLIIYLINALTATPTPFILVLDDYHLITQTEIHQAIIFLIEHVPPTSHLILISRDQPPFPLPRWQVQGKLNPVRADDLRLRPNEAAAYLHQLTSLTLTPAQITTLAKLTEGWIAALHLIALSLENRPDPAQFLAHIRVEQTQLFAYLADEVLARLPPATQTFLLLTALPQRFTPALADQLQTCLPPTHEPTQSAAAHLAWLEQNHLFLTRLDEREVWYRYHPLFRQFLLDRLQAQWPEQITPLHHQATAWFATHQLWTEAIEHTLAAADYPTLITLLQQSLGGRLLHGEPTLILRWLDSLLPEHFTNQPNFCLAYAWALTLNNQPDRALTYVRLAEQTLSPAEWPGLISNINAIKATLALRQYHLTEALHNVQIAAAALPDNQPILHSIVNLTAGMIYLNLSDLEAAQEAFTQAQHDSQNRHPFVHLSALTGLGHLHSQQGRLHQAATYYRQAIKQAEQLSQDGDGEAGMGAFLGLARMAFETNDLPTARRWAEKAIRIGQKRTVLEVEVSAWLLLARVQRAEQDHPAAWATLRHVEQLVSRHSQPIYQTQLAQGFVFHYLQEGDIAAADQWQTLSETYYRAIPTPQTAFPNLHHLVQCRRAWITLAQAQPEPALNQLHTLLTSARANGHTATVLTALLLQAWGYQQQGQMSQALTQVRQAVGRAAAGGYVRLLLDLGPPIHLLLHQAAAQGIYPTYINHLLRHTSPQEPTIPPSLSQREQEILHLLATGLSNREIAGRLHITPGTASWHTKNIYRKLNVRNRTEAAATLNREP
jgi:LuxR family maltose regulon positive regulatory protein